MLNSLAAVFHLGRGAKCSIEKFNPVVYTESKPPLCGTSLAVCYLIL